jgi:hypothetical protein
MAKKIKVARAMQCLEMSQDCVSKARGIVNLFATKELKEEFLEVIKVLESLQENIQAMDEQKE